MIRYSLSKKKLAQATGSTAQTYRPKGGFKTTLGKAIEGGNVAGILSVGHSGRLQYISSPQLVKDLTGTRITSIVGNTSDFKNEFSLAMMDMRPPLFFITIVDSLADFEFEATNVEALPEDALQGTTYAGKTVYAAAVPCFVPNYFGSAPVHGKITVEDTTDDLHQLGEGYGKWGNLIQEYVMNEDDVLKVTSHESFLADMATYVANLPRNATAFGTPAINLEQVSSSDYQDEATAIKRWYFDMLTAPSLRVPQPGVGASVLTTQDDLAKKTASDKGLSTMFLGLIGGLVDFEACTIGGVARAIPTQGAEEVMQLTTSATRTTELHSLLQTGCDLARTSGDRFNKLSNVTIKCIPTAFVNMLKAGNIATSPITSLLSSEIGSSITSVAFAPQHQRTNAIVNVQRQMQERANNAAANQATTSEKQVLELLGDIKSVDDVGLLLVNMIAIDRALVDLVKMEAKLTPCIAVAIWKKVLEWTMHLDSVLPEWRRNSGSDMNHMPWVVLSLVDSIHAHIGKFMNDHRNSSRYFGEGDLSGLDLTHLRTALTIFKAHRDSFALLVSQNAPHTTVPPLAPSHIRVSPAASARAGQSAGDNQEGATAKGGRARDAQPSRRAEDPSTSPSQARPQKKIKSAEGQQQDKRGMGWMHIPAGGKLRDAFPAGMKICGKFVTRGFQCDREDCKGHYISPTHLSEDNLQALCEHLFDTQAGWINKWKVKELKLDEKYLDTIVGIAGKPPKAKGA